MCVTRLDSVAQTTPWLTAMAPGRNARFQRRLSQGRQQGLVARQGIVVL